MERLIGIVGVAIMVVLALALSSRRRSVSWRLVLTGIGLQIVLAWLLIAFPPVVHVFEVLAHGVNAIIGATQSGVGFVWGWLGDTGSGGERFVFAIHAMSVVIFFASLMSLLYHLGVMQRLIAALAWLLRRTLRVTGTEALVVSANVFVGQTEAPLCVRPLIEKMTRSQITTLMVGGFATIAGSVLVAYVGILGGDDEAARIAFARHLIAASVLSAPAAFVIAKILEPETETPIDEGLRQLDIERPHHNALDAAASGASDGMRLALNIVAMLIAFVSLVALVNIPLGALGRLFDGNLDDGTGWQTLSVETILGTVFTPFAWAMGVAWSDLQAFGTLLGQKIVLTEFIAYGTLAEMIHGDEARLSQRSAAIAAFALCGFANIPSIAIQIGGLTPIAPGKRREFVSLGPRAMVGGALASWMTASIAGLFL